MVAAKLCQHHCTRSAASAAQSAARHMMAGATLSLRVTRQWLSARRAPCSQGAGRQADGGSEATSASLHTVCCQHIAERCPPHDGRRKAVTACDTPLAKRGAHALRAWGRVSATFRQVVAVNATSASLLTVCRQRSAADSGPPHGGRREAVTACDMLLVKRVAHARLAWGREAGRWWQRSHYGITAHDQPPA
jgi:hypothetical protein